MGMLGTMKLGVGEWEVVGAGEGYWRRDAGIDEGVRGGREHGLKVRGRAVERGI